MGSIRKKGESGAAVAYVNRTHAIRKLQLKLNDFRRLCILKGIYPVDPKNKKKINKGDSSFKTYYLKKDIQHLLHEPLLHKFREFSCYVKKLKKYTSKGNKSIINHFKQQKPSYSLEHVIKERYPTFLDALKDLDDALCMIFLFAMLPAVKGAFKGSSESECEVANVCSRFSCEFMHYVIESHSLKKTFISIKGIYYQAEICGVPVTWIVPHQFTQALPRNVDFKIMHTFVEFYIHLLKFVNYRLYRDIGMIYPPAVAPFADATAGGLKELVLQRIEGVEVPKDLREEQQLFSGLVFFISREVVRTPLEFVIRAFCGEVAWEGSDSPYNVDDAAITHQICDRPSLPEKVHLGRFYVQPQFVFDCVNVKKVLDASPYKPGVESLPPHLSPFVEEYAYSDDEAEGETASNADEGSSVANRPSNEQIMAAEADDSSDEDAQSNEENVSATNDAATSSKMEAERQQMAMSMMSKKERKLYDQLQREKNKKEREKALLKSKRQALAKSKPVSSTSK